MVEWPSYKGYQKVGREWRYSWLAAIFHHDVSLERGADPRAAAQASLLTLIPCVRQTQAGCNSRQAQCSASCCAGQDGNQFKSDDSRLSDSRLRILPTRLQPWIAMVRWQVVSAGLHALTLGLLCVVLLQSRAPRVAAPERAIHGRRLQEVSAGRLKCRWGWSCHRLAGGRHA